MADTKSYLGRELAKFFETVWLDLPAEAGKVLLGAGNQSELRKAGWKAYDAWISLANEVTNAAYSNRVIGELSGQVMESALRLRQAGGTIAASFFGNLWPSLGLSSHSEMVAVREELIALREELASYAARLPAPEHSTVTEGKDVLRGICKGAVLNGFRGLNGHGVAANGNGVVARTPAYAEKRNAAA
jgi:hypothetical protein